VEASLYFVLAKAGIVSGGVAARQQEGRRQFSAARILWYKYFKVRTKCSNLVPPAGVAGEVLVFRLISAAVVLEGSVTTHGCRDHPSPRAVDWDADQMR
jgi:hypothetical protein